MVVAENTFYVNEFDRWDIYKICIDSPVIDENGTDYYCRVSIENSQKNVYGINEVQSLILGVEYIKEQLKIFVEAKRELYLEKNSNSKLNIELALLSVFSKHQ